MLRNIFLSQHINLNEVLIPTPFIRRLIQSIHYFIQLESLFMIMRYLQNQLTILSMTALTIALSPEK